MSSISTGAGRCAITLATTENVSALRRTLLLQDEARLAVELHQLNPALLLQADGPVFGIEFPLVAWFWGLFPPCLVVDALSAAGAALVAGVKQRPGSGAAARLTTECVARRTVVSAQYSADHWGGVAAVAAPLARIQDSFRLAVSLG